MGSGRWAYGVRILVWCALTLCLSLRAQDRIRIVAGIDRNYPPYEYVGIDGQPAGFTVDLIREVAQEQGWELEIRAQEWTELRRSFERGEVDVLTGMSFSEERARTVAFTVPHSALTCAIFTRKGDSRIRSERDLAGKAILAQREDIAYERLVAKGYRVTGQPSPEAALLALAAGQGDCAVLAKGCALYSMKQRGLKNLQVIPGELFPERFCFAVLKDRDFLRAQLNEGLFYLRENGKLDAIFERHLGALEKREPPLGATLVRSAPVVIPAILGIALVVALGWSRSLRRLVRRRTDHLQRLNAIIEAINRSEAFEELMAGILREATFIQGVESTSIHVLDAERNLFRCRASVGWKGPERGWERIELTPEEAEDRYARNTQVLSEDIFLIHSAAGRRAEEKVRPAGISQSMLTVRVRLAELPVGYLIFNNLHDPKAIQVHDLDVLKSLKEHLVAAFQKARHIELLEEAKARAEREARFIEGINQSSQLDQLLAAILQESSFLRGVENAEVVILEPERNLFKCAASVGWEGVLEGWEAFELTPEEAEERYTRDTEMLSEDIFFIPSMKGRRAEEKLPPASISCSMLAVRIRIEGGVAGYFLFSNMHDTEAVKVHDLEMLKSLKEHMVSAFQKARNLELLEEAKSRAERAARFKGEFLANMSHEIRTPMNAILGFARLGLKQDLPPKANDYFRKIATSGQGLLEIINDILDLSKIEAGKLELESIPFRLSEVIEQVTDLFSQRAAEKDLELVASIATEVPDGLVGDPLRLGQVLVNLVGNALKFTRAGFIKVRVEKAAGEGGRVRLRFHVQDSGIGMMQEQQAGLFEAFSQGDASTTRMHGGTGLGLAISRQLVERMGGSISVSSELGVGSTFSFTSVFGLTQEPLSQLAGPGGLEGLRVLVVDDSDVARDSLEEQLRTFGFDVVSVESGEAALRELNQPGSAFDLVLMDWKMPGMDGIETSRRIKEDPRFAAIPEIIMVTAFGREEVVKAADRAGVRGFLMKPVSPSLLLDTTLEALGRERASHLRNPPDIPASPEEERIRGARVLVVDDNPINQQVAEEILQGAGVEVDLAGTGPEAIRLVDQRRYDAVLMDIQMPGMDGYEATAEIRKNPEHRTLPIIAMTAHALPGYREQCLAAGMNDYVAKPVEPQRLFAILEAWVKLAPAPAVSDRELEPPEELPGIDTRAALRRLGGNKGLLLQLLATFTRESASWAEDLHTAVAREEWDNMERLAHTLKGSSGNLSAARLHGSAIALERGVKDRALAALPGLLEEFDRAFEEIRRTGLRLEATHGMPNSKGSRVVPRLQGSVLEPHLQLLAEQLRLGSPDAEYPLSSLRSCLDGHPLGAALDAVEERFAAFDFKGAREALEKLVEELRAQAE